jgi:hypothetical protein
MDIGMNGNDETIIHFGSLRFLKVGVLDYTGQDVLYFCIMHYAYPYIHR